MIEPLRTPPNAFDVSCSGCGIVERLTNARYGEVLIRLCDTGWRIVAGRHYCRECEAPG